MKTRQVVRHAVLVQILFVLLAAGASPPSAPTVVVINKDSYTVLGTTVATAAELMAVLKEHKVAKVDLQYEDGEDYERVGGVIYGVTRVGIDIGHVNAIDVRKEVCANKDATVPAAYCAR